MNIVIFSTLILFNFSAQAQPDGDELTRTTSSYNLHSMSVKIRSQPEIELEKEISEAARHSYEKNVYIDLYYTKYPTREFIKKVNHHWRKTHDNLSDAMISAQKMGKSREWVMREFSN